MTAFSRTSFSKWKFFEPRTNLPHQANGLWEIESGIVRGYTWLDDGSIVTLGLWGTGELVSTFFPVIKPYELECLTEVKAVSIPWQNSPEQIRVLLNSLQSTYDLTLIRNYKTTDIMLIKLFTWLSRKNGKKTPNGQLIDIRLTHQDIADILGITRVTVTRSLLQLEKQGLIERNPLHRFILKEEEIWHYEI
jgi:CRP-like cAMP-binding protein